MSEDKIKLTPELFKLKAANLLELIALQTDVRERAESFSGIMNKAREFGIESEVYNAAQEIAKNFNTPEFWELPKPFIKDVQLAPFPISCLPEPLAEFLKSVSNYVQVYPEGYRTSKRDPLNDCISLDTPFDDEHDNITLADTIADNNAVNAVETAEIADDYRILHEAVDGLKSPMNVVINAYYFENKKFNEIGESIGVSTERIRQIKINAMRALKNNNMLMQLYRENRQHEELKAIERNRYMPDKFVLLLERYKQIIS